MLVPTTNVDSVLPVLRSVNVSTSGNVNKLIMTYSEALNNVSNFTEQLGNRSQGTAVSVFKSATISTVEGGQTITGLTFTVGGLRDGTDEKVTIDGSTFALTQGTSGATAAANNNLNYSVSVTGSTATVTLTKADGITAAQAQSLLTGMTYQNTNRDNPTPGLRVFDIVSITDSGAGNATSTFAAGTNSSSVLVTAVNDGPTYSTISQDGSTIFFNTPPIGVSVVGTNVILTTSGGAVTAGTTTVTYNQPASGNTAAIQDAAGNRAVTTTTATINTDTTAPVLDSSPVFYNGEWGISKFLIYFNEELASSASVANFSLSVVDPLLPERTGGGTITGQYGGSASVSGVSDKAVALSFNVANISPSASLQVIYTDPTANNDTSAGVVQDLAGNDAPNMVLGAWTNDILTAASFTAATRNVLVVGGQGNDTMTGGAANDTFTWFAGDAGATGAVDIVKSFTPWNAGAGDKINISKLLSGYSGGNNLSEWVTSITNNVASPDRPTGVSSGTNAKIVIDVDGTGAGTVTQTIWLDGVNFSQIIGSREEQLTALKNAGILIA